MKSKFYWQKRHAESHPFDLPRRISESVDGCRKNLEGKQGTNPAVRYIWIHLTHEGLRHGQTAQTASLSLDDWLNIIDESASLGAEWVVIYVGSSLSQAPIVWDLCKWAQATHDLNVGLHLTCDCLTDDDIERLAQLDRGKTYLVADGECSHALSVFAQRGVNVCKSDLHLRDKFTRCTKPADMACVSADGQLFSCGLVLGETEYALGSVHERRMGDVIADERLPHAIEDAPRFPTRGCEGCPPYVAEQVERLRGGVH
jgi:radical SAM protein with 4Fe4S-binding SPASM domain